MTLKVEAGQYPETPIYDRGREMVPHTIKRLTLSPDHTPIRLKRQYTPPVLDERHSHTPRRVKTKHDPQRQRPHHKHHEDPPPPTRIPQHRIRLNRHMGRYL